MVIAKKDEMLLIFNSLHGECFLLITPKLLHWSGMGQLPQWMHKSLVAYRHNPPHSSRQSYYG